MAEKSWLRQGGRGGEILGRERRWYCAARYAEGETLSLALARGELSCLDYTRRARWCFDGFYAVD